MTTIMAFKYKEKCNLFEMSQAFLDKSKQEIQKLKINVAQSLKEDIKSLHDNELHSDLIITNGSDVIFGHKCIFKIRTKHIWQDSWLTKILDPDGNEADSIELNGLTAAELDEFVRNLYVLSDPASLLVEYQHCLPGGQQSSQSGKSSSPDDFKLSCLSCEDKVTSEFNSTDDSEEMAHKCDVSLQRVNISVGPNCVCLSSAEGCVEKDSCEVEQSDDSIKTECECLGSNVNNFSVLTKDNLSQELVYGHQLNSSEHSVDTIQHDCLSSHNNSNINEIGECQRNMTESELNLMDSNIKMHNDSQSNHKDTQSKEDVSLETLDEEMKSLKPISTFDVEEKPKVQVADGTSTLISDPVPYETCSPLGHDLLQLYLEELDCDCCLAVDGIRFLVHKCILSARSEYFQAMLGGQWCESKMETINLEGVTPQAVEQLLLFLYGGVLELTTPCDLSDLFVVADMYGITSLKNVLAFYIRKDLCHFFHRPCYVCQDQGAEALSLCYSFNLPDLQSRVVKWIAKYFTKIWPTKTFAALPDVAHELSIEGIKEQMTSSNVLDIIMECNKLTTSLPRIKWTEGILCLLTQLMDTSIEFTSSHFIEVIMTQEFQQWAKVASWKAGALEEIFNTVIDSLPISMSCPVYQTLTHLEAKLSDQDTSDQDVVGLLQAMIKRCEQFFKVHINQVMRTKDWKELPQSVQSKILDTSAYFHLGDGQPNSNKSKLTFKQKMLTSGSKRTIQRTGKTIGQQTMTATATPVVPTQSSVRLRPKNCPQAKERPKSSVTVSEQAKHAAKSEQSNSETKARYTFSTFGFRFLKTEPTKSNNVKRSTVSQSNCEVDGANEGAIVQETHELHIISDNQVTTSCAEPLSESLHSKETLSSHPSKLLPSRIPVSTRSPKASRPKSMLRLNSTCTRSSDSSEMISGGEKLPSVEVLANENASGSADVAVPMQSDILENADMITSSSCPDPSWMTESGCSLPTLSSASDESSGENVTTVNVVTMNKTLNIGFTFPAE